MNFPQCPQTNFDSIFNFQNIMQKILSEIRERYEDKVILIVTHGDTGKMIRAVCHGWTWENGLKTPYFNNAGILELAKQDILK